MIDQDLKAMIKLIGKYSNALGRYGPDSPEVKQIREDNKDNHVFLEHADSLDQIKRNFMKK